MPLNPFYHAMGFSFSYSIETEIGNRKGWIDLSPDSTEETCPEASPSQRNLVKYYKHNIWLEVYNK